MSSRPGHHSRRRRSRSTFSPMRWSSRKRPASGRVERERRPGELPPTVSAVRRRHRWSNRFADATWPAAAAATLLGTTIAVVLSGLAVRLGAGFSSGPLTAPFHPSRSTVLGAGLLALAAGVRIPQRVAVWVCMIAWRRFVREGRKWDGSGVLVRPGAADRQLYWAIFSVVCLAAGLCVALLGVWIPLAARTYALLQEQFVWSQVSRWALNLAISLLAGFPPLALLGLAISCAHHLCCPFGHWGTRATAWAMIGAGIGTLLCSQLGESAIGAVPLLIGASLPPLVVAIVSAALGSTANDPGESPDGEGVGSLPACSDRWPTLLRASIVAVGGGGACAIAVWARWLSDATVETEEMLAPFLWSAGIGIVLGARGVNRGVPTIGAFGMSCAVAGTVVGVCAYVFAAGQAAPSWLLGLLASISIALIGYATSFGRTVLLSRVASRSTAGARMLARLLICSAVTILAAAPLAIHLFREGGTLMLVSASLIALGGLLVIHEPAYTPRVRRVRLSAVFGSVAAMILLGSMAAVSRQAATPVEMGGAVPVVGSPALPGGAQEMAVTNR